MHSSEILKCLGASEERLQIVLILLKHGDLRPMAIQTELGKVGIKAHQTQVSKHLSELRKCGLITKNKQRAPVSLQHPASLRLILNGTARIARDESDFDSSKADALVKELLGSNRSLGSASSSSEP